MMDFLKCRANKRIMSALLIVDLKSRKILKIWYENDWDPLTTKDLIVEEIESYRSSPQQYIQSQIGIRQFFRINFAYFLEDIEIV